MPGGNTTSRKRPHRMTKGEAGSESNHAMAGAKFWDPITGTDYINTETGLPDDMNIPNATPGGVDANAGFKAIDVGAGVVVSRNPKPAKGDATPGGGW